MTGARRSQGSGPESAASRLGATFQGAFPSEGEGRADAVGFLLLLVTLALTAAVDPPLAPLTILGRSHNGILGPVVGTRLVELFAFLTTFVTFFSRSSARPLRPLALPLAALAGVVVAGLGQLVPLPAGWLRIASPVNALIYHDARATLSQFGAALPSNRISIAPTETAGVLLVVLAAGALFLSAASLVRSRARLRLLAAVLFLSAAAGAARGMAEGFPGRPAGGADGCAARLEIAAAIGFAFVWAEILTGRARSTPGLDPSERIERRILPLAGRIAAWAGAGAGALVVASGSRSGAAAATIAAVLLPLAAILHARARRRWRAAFGLAAGAAAFAAAAYLLFGRPGTVGDLLRRDPAAANTASSAASIEAWRQFPIFGSGMGTFAEGFARVQKSATPERMREPGSDVFGWLVTTGAVGAALATLLASSVLFLLCRAWLRQKHREESAYALGGAGALLSILVQGLGAPVLTGTAVPIALAVLLGASWAAARAGSNEKEDFLR